MATYNIFNRPELTIWRLMRPTKQQTINRNQTKHIEEYCSTPARGDEGRSSKVFGKRHAKRSGR